MSEIRHSELVLRPDPSRTVVRPFSPGDPDGFAVPGRPRGRRILERVLALDDGEVRGLLDFVMETFESRHRDIDTVLLRRFEEVRREVTDQLDLSRERQLLIGAYFSEEYSFEAAALFNPSMVPHIDQSGLGPDEVRFAMSLRGIGEGHVSSVTFRTGTWSAAKGFQIDPVSIHAVPPRVEPLPELGEDAFCLLCDDSQELSETVLYPVTPSQKQGIEDVRLVRFVEEDGSVSFLGTYTAFSGSATRSELLRATGFNRFHMQPLTGVVAASKGTALFPRRVNGRYRMLGRQDNENIWLLASDHLTEWQEAARLVAPRYPWEFVQMGNCGSPIELDEGWLVLTHGVGVARNYAIGACLLDKDDPSRLLARTPRPLIAPSPEERDGYVPNVVYSCGGMVHGRTLLLPYGVADNFVTFASMEVKALLDSMA
jgi:predicted GH43/DUF377 family glycosyl hydrolase